MVRFAFLSAAFVAVLEMRVRQQSKKNRLCQPVPHPNMPEDFICGTVASVRNIGLWKPRFVPWFFKSRLSLGHHLGFLRHVAFGMRVERLRRPLIAAGQRLFPSVFS